MDDREDVSLMLMCEFETIEKELFQYSWHMKCLILSGQKRIWSSLFNQIEQRFTSSFILSPICRHWTEEKTLQTSRSIRRRTFRLVEFVWENERKWSAKEERREEERENDEYLPLLQHHHFIFFRCSPSMRISLCLNGTTPPLAIMSNLRSRLLF